MGRGVPGFLTLDIYLSAEYREIWNKSITTVDIFRILGKRGLRSELST